MTKGDPYHDKIGRFTTGPSGGASVSTNKLDAIFAKNAPRRITTFALPHDRVTELFNAMKNEGLVPQNLRSSFSIQWKGVDRNWQDGSFDNTFESHQQFKDFLATEGRRIDTVLASNVTSADASSKMNNAIRDRVGRSHTVDQRGPRDEKPISGFRKSFKKK